MTPAEIPAPPEGWVLACRCGLPVKLGTGNFESACLAALEHLKTCPIESPHATVAFAVTQLVATCMWTADGHYHAYRDQFYAAQQQAQQQGAPAVRRSGGCGACG
jgi:hypothetical protein